jgi:hypothetical protein
MNLLGELKVKGRTNYVFKVENTHTNSDNPDKPDACDFSVRIRKGTTGIEMTYALVTLLNVVYAHEETNGSKMSIDGFVHWLGLLLKDSQIGIPKGEDE